MIDHTFTLDWRHVALPLVLTGIVAVAAGMVAFMS
jgi:hypothetical protein